MPISQEAIKKQAVKKAVRKSKKLGHLVTEKDLFSLQIQILRTHTRVLLGALGSFLILASLCAWPMSSSVARAIEFIIGILIFIFGIIGIRRTLDAVLDPIEIISFCGDVLETTGEIVADIFTS